MNIRDFIDSISHPEYIQQISIHIPGMGNQVFTTDNWNSTRDTIILMYGCRKINKVTLYAIGRVCVYIDILSETNQENLWL